MIPDGWLCKHFPPKCCITVKGISLWNNLNKEPKDLYIKKTIRQYFEKIQWHVLSFVLCLVCIVSGKSFCEFLLNSIKWNVTNRGMWGGVLACSYWDFVFCWIICFLNWCLVKEEQDNIQFCLFLLLVFNSRFEISYLLWNCFVWSETMWNTRWRYEPCSTHKCIIFIKFCTILKLEFKHLIADQS